MKKATNMKKQTTSKHKRQVIQLTFKVTLRSKINGTWYDAEEFKIDVEPIRKAPRHN